MAKQGALGALCLRVAIVGVNFLVMLALAGLLGFATFGELAALWGAALVTGTVISLGGPVILLRVLTDGTGLRARDIGAMTFLYPAALAGAIYVVVIGVLPSWPLAEVLFAGYLGNVLGCLAGIMRALGSVQASMALRDGGPQVALGVAGVIGFGGSAADILVGATLVMTLFTVTGLVWVLCRPNMHSILSRMYRPLHSPSLWAASVLGTVVAQIDLILGAAVIPAEQLGVYAVLRRMANLVALPATVATWVSAPAISAAHGAEDQRALARASAKGSQIAMLPGLAFFTVGLMVIPILPVFLPGLAPSITALIYVCLLLAALGQVAFASSFTVATLCGLPGLAMAARAIMIASYLVWYQVWGSGLTVVMNALGYAGCLTLAGLALWWGVKRQIGIDTSAAVLLRIKGGGWKTS